MRCPGCHIIYAPASLAGGVPGGGRSARQLQRGILGATALLRSAADAGGAESRDALLETATGAERHAMRWGVA
ncbi:MAG: hypothetical protein OXE53_18450 [Deltaproteobacteria bacterium]|nr:hypothetical protein [Deltaproteobacteria bacterium]